MYVLLTFHDMNSSASALHCGESILIWVLMFDCLVVWLLLLNQYCWHRLCWCHLWEDLILCSIQCSTTNHWPWCTPTGAMIETFTHGGFLVSQFVLDTRYSTSIQYTNFDWTWLLIIVYLYLFKFIIIFYHFWMIDLITCMLYDYYF